jgi:hypothetical protein
MSISNHISERSGDGLRNEGAVCKLRYALYAEKGVGSYMQIIYLPLWMSIEDLRHGIFTLTDCLTGNSKHFAVNATASKVKKKTVKDVKSKRG